MFGFFFLQFMVEALDLSLSDFSPDELTLLVVLQVQI